MVGIQFIITQKESEVNEMEKKMNRTEATELLKSNLVKVAEMCAKMEKADPLKVAYLAGRMDGLADQAAFRERTA